MKTKTTKPVPAEPAEPAVASRISLRLDQPISTRFERVVIASRRTKTSIIEECLEKVLPQLEKHYAKAA